jgi:hypothetical protein
MSTDTAQVNIDPGPSGSVRLSGSTICADVAFDDAEIFEVLTQVPDHSRVEFFIRGARSGLIGMGNDVTGRLREAMLFMQATLETQVAIFGDRMLDKVRDQLGDAENDGYLEQRLMEILNEMKADMVKALPEVFESQTKRSMQFIQEEGERVMRQVAALFAENGIAWNVMHDVRRDFSQGMDEIKTAVTVAHTKAANPTPREAGLNYEAWIHRQLATIGSLRGDDVEFTAGKAGKVSRCLKGDTKILVAANGVEVTAPPCVAVEIRDREESEFRLADLDAMIDNREAQVALVVAAHAGSLPRQYSDRSFTISRPKRLITLVLDPDCPVSEVVLAATYDLASALAIDSVRCSRAGDWEAAAHKVDEIELAIEAIVDARTAFSQIEKKAHDAGTDADGKHVLLVRRLAELRALLQME